MEQNRTESILGTARYDVIARFFQASWGLTAGWPEYECRVYVTRRCFFLNQLFLRHKKESATPEELRKIALAEQTFMTQSALLGKAEELTERYRSSGSFPKILIVDELVVNGIEIAAMLQRLEELVCEAYEAKTNEPMCGDRQLALRNALLCAVDVRVCVRADQSLLIADRYANRIQADKTMRPVAWRDYVQDVNLILNMSTQWFGGKAYLPLFTVSSTEWIRTERLNQTYPDGVWEKTARQYHSRKTVQFVNCNRGSQLENKLVLVMSCRSDTTPGKESVRLVPVPFIGRLSLSHLDRIAEDTAACLKRKKAEVEGLSVLINLLESNLNLQQEKMQLISFLIALISAREFADALSLKRDISFADAELCAMNFGRGAEVKAALSCLWEDNALLDALKDAIYPLLREAKALKAGYVQGGNKSHEEYLLDCEDFFIAFSQQRQECVTRVRNADMFFGTKVQERDPARCRLNEYLSRKPENDLSRELQSFLLLAEYGYCSYNFQADAEAGEIGMFLRAGELSGELSVSRMYRFIPALIRLEEYCRANMCRLDKKCHDFADYLNRDGRYPGLTDAIDRLVVSLSKLGQRFEEWNIPLLLDIDKPDRKNGVRTKLAYSRTDRSDAEWSAINAGRRIDYLRWEFAQREEIGKELDNFISTL